MLTIRRFLTHPVVKDTTWVGLVQGLVILIGFATSAIIARVLGPEGLGIYQLLLAWVAVSSIFGLPGMNVVVLKSALKNYDRFYWLALRKSLLFSGIGTILVASIGCALYLYQGAESKSAIFVLLVAASIPLSGFQNYDSVLVGKRDFRASRLLNLFGSILSLLFTGSVAWMTKQAEWTFSAYLLSRVAVLAAGFWVVQRKLNDCQVDPQMELELFVQGWRQTGLAVLALGASRLDRIVLGAMDPVLLSYYYVGTMIPLQLKNNAKLFLNILSVHWGLRSGEDNISALNRHGGKLLLLGGLMVCLMWLCLPFLIPLFFGEEYTQAVSLGMIYSIALLPMFWVNMIGQESQLQGSGAFNQKSQILRYTVLAVCIIVLSQFGVVWIVFSHLLADYSLAAWSYLYLKGKSRVQV
ncbi:MAG: lipopolysaccharide biosynthesis protein [Candidatus Scalindua sp.]